VVQVAVLFRLFGNDAVLGGSDSAAFHLFEGHGGASLERSDSVDDGSLVGAGIGERAYQHVAADSRKCIQVAKKRHDSFIVAGRKSLSRRESREPGKENQTVNA
jgi:hypothetical protein